MSKYSLAKDQIRSTVERANEDGIDENEAIEALIVTAIQSLISSRGASDARNFLKYELDSIGSGDVFEIQRH